MIKVRMEAKGENLGKAPLVLFTLAVVSMLAFWLFAGGWPSGLLEKWSVWQAIAEFRYLFAGLALLTLGVELLIGWYMYLSEIIPEWKQLPFYAKLLRIVAPP